MPTEELSIGQLREFLEHLIETNDKIYLQRYESSQEAIKAALTANDKRLDSMNEFRFALADQSARMMPRTEATAALEAVMERGTISRDALATKMDGMVRPLQAKMDEMGKTNWPLLASFMSVAALLVGGLWLIIGLKIDTSVAPINLTEENLKAQQLAQVTTANERLANRESQVKELTASVNRLAVDMQGAQRDLAALKATQVVNSARITAVEQNGSSQRTDLRTAQASMGQKMVEIETQFKSMSHVINLMKDDNQQMFGVLWSKNFPGVNLPMKEFRPTLYNENMATTPP